MIPGLRWLTLKNFVAAAGGQALGALFFLAINIVVAGSLGPARYGTWSFLLATGIIIWSVIENALTPVYMRKFVESPEEFRKIWSELLSYVLFLGFLGYIFFVAIILVIKKQLLLEASCLGLSIILLLIVTACNTVFRAMEKQEFFFCLLICQRLLLLLLILSFKSSLNLMKLIVIYVFVDLVYLFISLMVIIFRFHLPIAFRISWITIWKNMRSGFPFSLAQVFRRLAFQAEIFLGYILLSPEYVGLYALAFRVPQVFSQIAQTACTALFVPLLRRGEVPFGNKYLATLVSLLLGAGLLTGVVNYFCSPLFIELFGYAYSQSLEVLKIFSLLFPFILLYPFFFYYFAAKNMEIFWLKIQAFLFLFQFVFSYFLIENFVFKGMIISKILNEFFVLLGVTFGFIFYRSLTVTR